MEKKFNKWRCQQMTLYSDGGGLAHYHRCSDALYGYVRKFCIFFIKKKIDLGETSCEVRLSDDLIQNLYSFLMEMELSYIHPRSTSAHFLFSRKNDTANP